MKYLYLIRHAKSSWSDPSLSDFDRPLNKRGKRDLPVMGQRMAAYEPKPELIISSPAKRARRTARTIGSALGFTKQEIALDEELYTFSPEGFFEVIRRTTDEIQVLALVGHNHGLTECAEMLSGESLVNVPTCGIVLISFDQPSWHMVTKGGGSLVLFDYPKRQPTES
jgi:phosphohistidine phosphatase